MSYKKRFFFTVVASCLPVLLLFTLLESLATLFQPEYLNGFRAIYFAGDKNTPKLFTNDPLLHWKLRKQVTVRFLNQSVHVTKEGFRGKAVKKGLRSILIVGDSTPFGWKVSDDATFGSRISHILNNELAGGKRWQTLNAGVPGYTSFQTFLAAREYLREWKPDYIVICVGNNEGWPAKKSDKQIYEEFLTMAKVETLFSKSTLYLWLKYLYQKRGRKPFLTSAQEGKTARVTQDEYIQNVGDIVSLARESDTTVILLSPPVNLFYPPMSSGELNQERFDMILAHAKKGDYFKALSMIDSGLSEDPDRYELLWLKGNVFMQTGRRKEGWRLLEKSFEVQPYPDRSKLSYRNALHTFSIKNNINFFDINEYFYNYMRKNRVSDLYLDWCHPSGPGHELIARSVVEIIKDMEKKE